jgi:hypothetical protein
MNSTGEQSHIEESQDSLTYARINSEILKGLHKVGFKTNDGDEDAGFLITAWNRRGGYYLGQRWGGFLISTYS